MFALLSESAFHIGARVGNKNSAKYFQGRWEDGSWEQKDAPTERRGGER
jgi:hypothetical protein